MCRLFFLGCVLLAWVGCNCSAATNLTKTKTDTKPEVTVQVSQELIEASIPVPVSPDPPDRITCRGATLQHRVGLLTPMVGMIYMAGPENGLEVMDSLSMGMGIESTCCATYRAISTMTSLDPKETDDKIGKAKQRAQGFLLNRCTPKRFLRGDTDDL